jgi:hypothetical protein
MQISMQEVERVLERTAREDRNGEGARPRSLVEMAADAGLSPADLRRYAETVRMAENDLARERRVSEVIARVRAGQYAADPAAIVDMAERRAAADRAAQ